MTGAIVIALLHAGIHLTTEVAEAIQGVPLVAAALPEVVVTMMLLPQVRVQPRFPLRLTGGKGILCACFILFSKAVVRWFQEQEVEGQGQIFPLQFSYFVKTPDWPRW